MSKNKKEIEKDNSYCGLFEDIVRVTLDEHRNTDNNEFHKDSVVKAKRAFLQMKRIYPVDSISVLCQKTKMKSEQVFRDWCRKDREFKIAYEIIDSALSGYITQLYEKNRLHKRTT